MDETEPAATAVKFILTVIALLSKHCEFDKALNSGTHLYKQLSACSFSNLFNANQAPVQLVDCVCRVATHTYQQLL